MRRCIEYLAQTDFGYCQSLQPPRKPYDQKEPADCVSRSAINRKAIEASVEQLQQLQERRWEDVGILGIELGRWRTPRR